MPCLRLSDGLRLCLLWLVLFWQMPVIAAEVSAGVAAGTPDRDSEIETLTPLVREFFPQVEYFGPFGDEPRAAPVYADDDELIGYVYLTDQILPIPAYSGKPISTLVALDMHGTIVGVRIVHHEEPILLAGVSEAQLAAYVQQYRGINARERIKVGGAARSGYATVDAISGATITVMVINQTISKTLQQVASARGLLDGGAQRAVATASDDSLSIWRMVWRERMFRIGVLVAALIVLTLILLFQDWLARRPRLSALCARRLSGLYRAVHRLVHAGAVVGHQRADLRHAIMHDFRWETVPDRSDDVHPLGLSSP